METGSPHCHCFVKRFLSRIAIAMPVAFLLKTKSRCPMSWQSSKHKLPDLCRVFKVPELPSYRVRRFCPGFNIPDDYLRVIKTVGETPYINTAFPESSLKKVDRNCASCPIVRMPTDESFFSVARPMRAYPMRGDPTQSL